MYIRIYFFPIYVQSDRSICSTFCRTNNFINRHRRNQIVLTIFQLISVDLTKITSRVKLKWSIFSVQLKNFLFNNLHVSRAFFLFVTLKPPQTHDRKLHFFNYFKIGSDILILISFLFIIQLHLQIRIESNIVLSDTY